VGSQGSSQWHDKYEELIGKIANRHRNRDEIHDGGSQGAMAGSIARSSRDAAEVAPAIRSMLLRLGQFLFLVVLHMNHLYVLTVNFILISTSTI
jgi:hypothetical protein